MSELPGELTRSYRATDALIKRLRALSVSQQATSFEVGQESFRRWADGTRKTLSKFISEAEAVRFDETTSLYTFESLEQYQEVYSSYLEALLETIRINP